MAKPSQRSYRKSGLDFSNLDFASKAERLYVKKCVEQVAVRLRRMRKDLGYSQEYLAELAAVSIGTIKSIELNQRSPSLPVLFKLLYVLDRNCKVWT
jgi:DNA-binding XRE family transcriptional regulator